MKLTYRDSDEGEPNLKERQSQSIQRINMGPIVHDKKERDAQLEENSNGSGICSKLSRCEMEAIKLDSTSISTCMCVYGHTYTVQRILHILLRGTRLNEIISRATICLPAQ